MTFNWTVYVGAGLASSLGLSVTAYGNFYTSAATYSPSGWATALQSGPAAHQVSVTTLYGQSIVFAATINGAAAITPVNGSGTHWSSETDSSTVDTANTAGYASQSAFSAAVGDVVSIGCSNTNAGGVAAVEVPVSGAYAWGGATPSYFMGYATSPGSESTSTSSGLPWSYPAAPLPQTSPAGYVANFGLTALESPVVLCISAAANPANSSSGQVAMTVTDSYGLTWTELVDANGGGNGYAGVWIGIPPAGTPTIAPTTTPPTLIAPGAVTLPQAVQWCPYAASLTPTGGWVPWTWALASGSSMPSGLALDPRGVITGTPAVTGTFTFNVVATDQLGAATAAASTVTLTIVNVYGGL